MNDHSGMGSGPPQRNGARRGAFGSDRRTLAARGSAVSDRDVDRQIGLDVREPPLFSCSPVTQISLSAAEQQCGLENHCSVEWAVGAGLNAVEDGSPLTRFDQMLDSPRRIAERAQLFIGRESVLEVEDSSEIRIDVVAAHANTVRSRSDRNRSKLPLQSPPVEFVGACG